MIPTVSTRICLYCSRAIGSEDRVAACDVCYAAHHEECWERNGRCSTFRCVGQPRTMRGSDLPTVVQVAMERANEAPDACSFCSSKVYAGAVQSRPIRPPGSGQTSPSPGLMFVGKGKPNPHKDWFGKHFLAKMLGNRMWFLPGAKLNSRSCGKCHRLYLRGRALDDQAVQRTQEDAAERYCPHCATVLWRGSIILEPHPYGARFRCDETPDFHADWIGHNILDRYFLNQWRLSITSLPAQSCADCNYTEVAGQPVYRFV